MRLSGGITYLIVSVAVTESLDGLPITLTWSPGGFDADIDYVDEAPAGSIVIPGLRPGRNYIVTWPGASFDRAGKSSLAAPNFRLMSSAAPCSRSGPAGAPSRMPTSMPTAPC